MFLAYPAFNAITSSLRLPNAAVILAVTSFITYRIFKRFEPDKPLSVTLLLIVVPSWLVSVLRSPNDSHFEIITTTFASYYVLILFYVAIYRLSPLHPLARYPGPISAKLSKITLSYILYTGKQHLFINKLHDRYGDIVRIGPNELSVNRADAIQPILSASGLPKGVCWYNRVPDGQPTALITTRDPLLHKQRRRVWDRALSTASVKNYEELVLKRTKELLEQFELRVGQVIDVSSWMGYFAYDFMGDMTWEAFGAGFNMMKKGSDTTGVWSALEAYSLQSAVFGHIPWAYTYLRMIPGAAAPRNRFAAIAIPHLSRRVSQGSKIKDLFYHITDEEGREPVKPSMPTVFSDGIMAIVAGSDTTATTLTAMWYYFLLDPTMLQRLQEEIDAYFPGGEEPRDFTRMVNMPFLNACINETLRLLPPIISGSQRSTPRGSGGKVVGPYFIPEGTQVMNHTYSLHRNPRCFSPFPESFIPDRWLPEKDRRNIAAKEPFILDLSAYNPFSHGPANCVGKNFALAELRAVTCFVVQRFNFRPVEGFRLESWEEGIEDYFVVTRPPLPVVLEGRC